MKQQHERGRGNTQSSQSAAAAPAAAAAQRSAAQRRSAAAAARGWAISAPLIPPAVLHHRRLQPGGQSCRDLSVPSCSQLSAWYDGAPRTQQLAANWRPVKTCAECRRGGSAARPAGRSARRLQQRSTDRPTTRPGWRSVRHTIQPKSASTVNLPRPFPPNPSCVCAFERVT